MIVSKAVAKTFLFSESTLSMNLTMEFLSCSSSFILWERFL